MEPGQTILPGGAQEAPTTWQFNADTAAQTNLPPIQPSTEHNQPVASTPTTVPTPASGPNVSWTASEFIAHNKPSGWYGLLAIGGLVLAAAVFLLTKDKVSSGVIIVVAILFGLSAARKPRELQYQVDEQGVQIAEKAYPYKSFRSFSIVQEEGVESIWFMPLKRFMPTVSIYFDPNDGDKIVDILSQFLPIENRGLDPVDRLMHRLRF